MKNTYKTKLSEELTYIFDNQLHPFFFGDINNILISRGIESNKTSIYRQLQKMLEDNTIKTIDTPNGKVWEIRTKKEHTHLVCDSCRNIICLQLDPSILDQIINLNKSIQFKIKNFNLSGLCAKCLQIN